MAVTLERLPRFLVLEPSSTVRLEVVSGLRSPEIDVELGNPAPGRAYLLMVGPEGGPMVQRMRLTGRARVQFAPGEARTQVLMVANPAREPLVLHLEGHLTRARARPVRSGPARPSWAARRGPRRGPGPVPPTVLRPRRADPWLPVGAVARRSRTKG